MASRTPELLTYAVPSWGVGALAHRQGRPVLHDLPAPRRRPAPLHLDAAACDPEALDPAERLVARLGRYFRGEPQAFDPDELGLEASCEEWGLTGFARRAARALWAVPWGEVVSYGELAERAGAPRAARAAGTFCAGIQLGLFLPAHRVLRADGSLGEYGPSVTRTKARLLRLEGVRGPRDVPRRAPRIVCLGGGTGLSYLLRGLKLFTPHTTAIVTLTDDGGSSGRLRRELEIPPPGDVRSCLVALAEDESFMGRLFQHRFSRGELAGHSFGNLFLAALTEVVGSFDVAVAESSRVLAIEGTVVPATTHPAALAAEMEDGRTMAGETAISTDRRHVRRLFLDPPDAIANAQALEALHAADLIVMGPGSLFTSTLPPLLVPAIRQAVLASTVPRVYVCNLLQQPGETHGYRASNHIERLYQHVGPGCVDVCVVPSHRLVTHLIPVLFDRARLDELGVEVVSGRIAHEHHHDPPALGRVLTRIAARPRALR